MTLSLHFNQARTFHEQGQLVNAETAYRRALSIEPQNPEALNGLAGVLEDRGELKAASYILEGLCERFTQHEALHFNLATLCVQLGEPKKAICTFETVVSLNPTDWESWLALGDALRHEERFDAALKAYQQVVAIQPRHSESFNSLGVVALALGNVAQAVEAFRACLAIKPNHAAALRHLIMIDENLDKPEMVQELEGLYSQLGSDKDRLQVAFAFGKLHEDIKSYETSFHYYAEANRLKRDQLITEGIKTEDRIADLIRQISTDVWQAPEKPNGSTVTPIFVLGMPRSGTTMVEQILSSHPKVEGARETPAFLEAISNLGGAGLFETLATMDEEKAQKIRSSYLGFLKDNFPRASYVVNKTPGNYMLIGAILMALPKARIIHCRRAPLDTCFSIYANLFNVGHHYAYDLSDLGREYSAYQKLMDHWQDLFDGQIHHLDYESLVDNQDGETRRLLNYCGLDWDERCLAFQGSKQAVTSLSAAQVRRPVYTTSVGRWKPYEPYLSELIEQLNDLA